MLESPSEAVEKKMKKKETLPVHIRVRLAFSSPSATPL